MNGFSQGIAKMISKAEQDVASSLRDVLAPLEIGATIVTSEQFLNLLSALAFFLPEVLREIHPEGKYESLDGVIPAKAKKIEHLKSEMLGECIFISDQTLTPFHLRLRTHECEDKVPGLELRLGQTEGQGMKRFPYESPSATLKLVYRHPVEMVDRINWAYKVTYGTRE